MEDNRGKRVAKINKWVPKEFQKIVERDGKLFICNFDKLFGYTDKLKAYKTFVIGKESYINQLDIIVQYTNFFINNYDPEKELVAAYLKIKYALDLEDKFNAESMLGYIDFIYEVMFTDSMIDHIRLMVEENYLDDIEVNTEEKSKYLKNEKKHLESLEFTNEHIKILLMISFGMKIMSPVMFHYLQMNHIKIEKDSEIIFQFYKRLFSLFGYGNYYELYDAETGKLIYSKIDEKLAEEFIKNNNLRISKNGDERRYYFSNFFNCKELLSDSGIVEKEVEEYEPENENDARWYLCRNVINIYNKLYVYVTIALAHIKTLKLLENTLV